MTEVEGSEQLAVFPSSYLSSPALASIGKRTENLRKSLQRIVVRIACQAAWDGV